MNKRLAIILSLGFSIRLWAATPSLRPEIPDPQSVKAFGQFWQGFDDYENTKRQTAQNKELGSWEQIRREFSFQDANARDAEIELLEDAVKRYRDHLQTHPGAANAPYVKLNLAQIYANIAGLREEISPKSGDQARKNALSVLSEIQRDHPDFAIEEASLYLKASLLDSIGQNESAFKVWKELASEAKSTIYGIHAFLAVGDHQFDKERSEEALKAYQSGLNLLKKSDVPNKDAEELRFQYRIAWAAYRTAKLDRCIKTATELLEPGREFSKSSVKKKVENDAIELTANALFENDNMQKTKTTLQNKLIRGYAAAIGFKIMKRLMALDDKQKLLELGEFLAENYPHSRDLPEILTLLSSVYQSKKMEEQYLASLERLSLLLPITSLWRYNHQTDTDALRRMEEKALAATLVLASHYYEQGIVQGTPAQFKTAKTYYDNLLRAKPNHPDAETWKLRQANCLYFADQLPDADRAYEQFKTEKLVNSGNLEIASYQQILTREKIWRQSIQKTTNLRGNISKDPIVVENLRRLEQAIDKFSDRFPNRPHTVDLLLLAASANRDLDNYIEAEKYWSRTLLSEPGPGQRTIAIRGLVQSKIKQGDPNEVINITRNYLKLENWDEMGTYFNSELRGVLSAASKEASEKLNKKGDVLGAGQILLAVANEFPDLPDYNTLYRDGAYYLALGGAWGEAERASDKYLALAERPKAADLLYLKARAEEYQLKFRKSAATHLAVAERYPRFNRSPESVLRAEELAVAEDDFKTAGQAAMLATSFQKSLNDRYGSFVRAAGHYKNIEEYDQSLAALKDAQKIARQPETRLKTNLEIARLVLARGNSEEAKDLYQQIALEATRRQEKLDKAVYQAAAGEAYFQLADFERKSFDMISATPAESLDQEKLNEKTARLEKSLGLYAKAIGTLDPEWSTRARFGAGQIAEKMGQTIRNNLAKQDRQKSEPDERSQINQANRWQSLAQEYFSQNLVARNREPHRYKDTVWIEKSAMKISGLNAPGPKLEEETELPASMEKSTPYMWSH